MISRLAWAAWALVPVGVLFFHYGPGQKAYVEDRAARIHRAAVAAERDAAALQERAYASHLEALEARRRAFLSGGADDERAALEATAVEEQAYATAAASWKTAAEGYQQVLATLGDAAPEQSRAIRVARARATVRAGEIWPGIAELEQLLVEFDATNPDDQRLARVAREELATACYYGARLLRLSGMPPQEWMIESGKARQQFRYLAEQARTESADHSTELATDYQRNLELVLNLEQSTLVELQGRPLPKDSPRRGNMGNRPNGQDGKSQRPPNRRDARGAGGAEAIRDGW